MLKSIIVFGSVVLDINCDRVIKYLQVPSNSVNGETLTVD
jgi:hypothetical protein